MSLDLSVTVNDKIECLFPGTYTYFLQRTCLLDVKYLISFAWSLVLVPVVDCTSYPNIYTCLHRKDGADFLFVYFFDKEISRNVDSCSLNL